MLNKLLNNMTDEEEFEKFCAENPEEMEKIFNSSKTAMLDLCHDELPDVINYLFLSRQILTKLTQETFVKLIDNDAKNDKTLSLYKKQLETVLIITKLIRLVSNEVPEDTKGDS